MIESTISIINVANLSIGLDFYKNVLRFAKDWETEVDFDKIAGISRDGCSIYLCEGKQGASGSWLWIGVESAEYFDQVIAYGATVLQQATNYPWAYELRVQDPDGNVIRLGTGRI